MTEEGADAVGANCGIGIAEYVPICSRLRAATALPIWIKANAGLPEMDGRQSGVSHDRGAVCLAPAGADRGGREFYWRMLRHEARFYPRRGDLVMQTDESMQTETDLLRSPSSRNVRCHCALAQ